MSIKLQREFQMTVYPLQYVQGGTQPFGQPVTFTTPVQKTITIQNPFTIIFNISRAQMAAQNSGNFQIYNLNPTTRNQLYKDFYSRGGFMRMTLAAGYFSQGSLPIIFDGAIHTCSSYRKQGNVNFITEMDADNWSFPTYNAHTSQNYNTVVPKQKVVDQLVKDVCAMGPPGGQLSRGYIYQYVGQQQYYPVISENSWNRLRTETDGACFIDNGFVHVLGNNQYIPGNNFTISAATGLLGSPKRYQNLVTVEIMFEPSLQLGQKVTLDSISNTTLNGDYIIQNINHAGIISDTIGGKLQTTLGLFNLQKNATLATINASTA